LVLDESSSILKENWKEVKNFAMELVSKAGISEHGNRAAVVSFAGTARNRIKCDTHRNTEDFLDEIKNLHQKGRYTNMEDGLVKGKNRNQFTISVILPSFVLRF
jgi:von Willebrand factor type A domain.